MGLDTSHIPDGPYAGREENYDPGVRARALELLAELGRECPTFRLGQLLCGLAATADSFVTDSVYDLEDQELVAAAEEWLAQRRAERGPLTAS